VTIFAEKVRHVIERAPAYAKTDERAARVIQETSEFSNGR
jgi:hypothetical protein